MTSRPAWILLALSLIGTAHAAGTQRMPFPQGGTIRLENFTGYLTVEGWDQPEVEITTDSPVAERHSDRELTISMTFSTRRNFLVLPRTIDADCTVRIPRNSHLIVHHHGGYVLVSNVAGDIEVHSHTGDVIVTLPDPGPYSVDARSKLGNVTSDFAGEVHSRFLLGTYLANTGEVPSHRIYLRIGRGSIAVKKDPSPRP
jgi:hypothetical protein